MYINAEPFNVIEMDELLHTEKRNFRFCFNLLHNFTAIISEIRMLLSRYNKKVQYKQGCTYRIGKLNIVNNNNEN